MAETSETRIDLRTDHYRKRIIARAAELSGMNVTQFIMDRVYPEAEKVVAGHESGRVILGEEAWATFCLKLDEAPRELSALKALLSAPDMFSYD